MLDLEHQRSFATRRACVDILKKFQSTDALVILKEAASAVAMEASGATSPAEQADAADLEARITAATSPYFP